MSVELEEQLYQMPSVQRFINNVVEDISNRRCLIVLLPEGIHIEPVWAQIRVGLWRRDLIIQELGLIPNAETKSPASSLVEGLGLQWSNPETPYTLLNIANCDNLPEVIYIRGLEDLAYDEIQNWMMVFEQWAQISQQRRNLGSMPTSLCLIIPADKVLTFIPESNVYLALHWWWGFPSVLETHLLCRLVDDDFDNLPSVRWREYILPSLALGDMQLVELLWTTAHKSFMEQVDILSQYAAFRHWQEDGLESILTEGAIIGLNHHQVQHRPPVRFQGLWAKGLLQYTIEYGIELHSAALAALEQKDVLRYRIWRGQSELLLPILDGIRLRVCQNLTSQYGVGWPLRWDEPASEEDFEAVKTDPMAASWGYIEHLLKTVRELRPQRHWLPVVSACRTMRNNIAHYRTVNLQDYEYIQREISTLENQ
jgi:hypothetical protein